MKKNITRVDALNTAIDMITNTIELNGSGDPDEAKLTETVEVLTSIRDTITKANSRKSDKPTKTQVENAGIKAELLTHITAGHLRPEGQRPALSDGARGHLPQGRGCQEGDAVRPPR